MSILNTCYPKISIVVKKESAAISLESSLLSLENAIGNLNIIINKAELRNSLCMDDEIEFGICRSRLMTAEELLTEVKGKLDKLKID